MTFDTQMSQVQVWLHVMCSYFSKNDTLCTVSMNHALHTYKCPVMHDTITDLYMCV